MSNAEVVIYIVDDDSIVCRSFERLFKLAGFAAACFASAEDFLQGCPADARGCLLLDVHMPGLSGLDLQQELDARNIFLPIVFISGKGDIPMTVRAMKAGAVDFLAKPCDEARLLEAAREAIARDARDRQTLASVETAAAQTAARADAKTHQAAPPFKPRMIKAVTASILMLVVPTIWILTNWPMALNRLMIYTAVLACFNALFPSMPRRAILTALFWGVLGGAILYFVVMRPLQGFLELALALCLVLLPCCYFVNSPNPLTMIKGLFSGMIIIGLMDLSLVQSYSFSTFANNAIGYSGGFMIALIILQLFTNSTPEQTFRKNVLAFFHSCGQSIDVLSADPHWTEKGKSCLASGQSGILKSLKMSGLWSRMANPRRATENDAGKVGRLLADMQCLLFRIEMVENARFQAPDDSALATFSAGERELRESLTESLSAIQSTILGNVVASEPSNNDATAAQSFRRQVASLCDQLSKDAIDHASVSRVLVLMGYYQALADAIDKCHEDVQALNWQRWERSYI